MRWLRSRLMRLFRPAPLPPIREAGDADEHAQRSRAQAHILNQAVIERYDEHDREHRARLVAASGQRSWPQLEREVWSREDHRR